MSSVLSCESEQGAERGIGHIIGGQPDTTTLWTVSVNDRALDENAAGVAGAPKHATG